MIYEKNRHKNFFKSVSFLLCFFLSATNLFAGSQTALPLSKDVLSKHVIPAEFGVIDKTYISTNQTKKKRHVFLIQDAHDSLEAQENISSLIDHFVREKNVKMVLEEGYEGEVPSDEYFKNISSEKKQKISYFLLDQLRLSGAEYAHINRQKDFELIGIDYKELYIENVKAYGLAIKNQKYVEQLLKPLEKKLMNMMSAQLPKSSEEWFNLNKRYERNEMDLMSYLKRSQKMHKNGEYDALEYPLLSRVMKGEVENLEIERYSEFFKEIEKVQMYFDDQAFNTASLKKAYQYWKKINLFLKLSQLRLSSEEYQRVKKDLEDSQTPEMADFIFKETGKSFVLSKGWEKALTGAVDFYELAEDRDLALEENLTRQTKGVKNAVLVFGGFHKNNILKILERNGYSYTVISPRMTEVSLRHQGYYQTLMSQGFHDYERNFLRADAARAMGLYYLGFGREILNQIDLVMKQTPMPDEKLLANALSRFEPPKAFSELRAGEEPLSKAKEVDPRSELRSKKEQALKDIKAKVKRIYSWIKNKVITNTNVLIVSSLASLAIATAILHEKGPQANVFKLPQELQQISYDTNLFIIAFVLNLFIFPSFEIILLAFDYINRFASSGKWEITAKTFDANRKITEGKEFLWGVKYRPMLIFYQILGWLFLPLASLGLVRGRVGGGYYYKNYGPIILKEIRNIKILNEGKVKKYHALEIHIMDVKVSPSELLRYFKLLFEDLAKFQEEGYSAILSGKTSNPALIKLAQRMGFQSIEKKKGYFSFLSKAYQTVNFFILAVQQTIGFYPHLDLDQEFIQQIAFIDDLKIATKDQHLKSKKNLNSPASRSEQSQKISVMTSGLISLFLGTLYVRYTMLSMDQFLEHVSKPMNGFVFYSLFLSIKTLLLSAVIYSGAFVITPFFYNQIKALKDTSSKNKNKIDDATQPRAELRQNLDDNFLTQEQIHELATLMEEARTTESFRRLAEVEKKIMRHKAVKTYPILYRNWDPKKKTIDVVLKEDDLLLRLDFVAQQGIEQSLPLLWRYLGLSEDRKRILLKAENVFFGSQASYRQAWISKPDAETFQDEVNHYKILRIEQRSLDRSELRLNADIQRVSKTWDYLYHHFQGKAFNHQDVLDSGFKVSLSGLAKHIDVLKDLGLIKKTRQKGVSGRPLRISMIPIDEQWQRQLSEEHHREFRFVLEQYVKPGDETLIKEQIQRIMQGKKIFSLPKNQATAHARVRQLMQQSEMNESAWLLWVLLRETFKGEWVKSNSFSDLFFSEKNSRRLTRNHFNRLQQLGIIETQIKESTSGLWIRIKEELTEKQIRNIEEVLLKKSDDKKPQVLAAEIQKILDPADQKILHQSVVKTPKQETLGKVKLSLPRLVRAIEEEEKDQKEKGEGDVKVKLSQIANRLGIHLTTFHSSPIIKEVDLRRLGISGLALGLPIVQDSSKWQKDKRKPLDRGKAKPLFEKQLIDAVSRLRGDDTRYQKLPVRLKELADELMMSDTALRDTLKELDLESLLPSLGVFSFKPISVEREEYTEAFLRSLGVEPTETLTGFAMGRAGYERKVNKTNPEVQKIQSVLVDWEKGKETRRLMRRKAYVEALQEGVRREWQAMKDSEPLDSELRKRVVLIVPEILEATDQSQDDPEEFIDEIERKIFREQFNFFYFAVMARAKEYQSKTHFDFRKLVETRKNKNRKEAERLLNEKHASAYGQISLNELVIKDTGAKSMQEFWRAWDAADDYASFEKEMIDALRRVENAFRRSELRKQVVGDQKIDSVIRKSEKQVALYVDAFDLIESESRKQEFFGLAYQLRNNRNVKLTVFNAQALSIELHQLFSEQNSVRFLRQPFSEIGNIFQEQERVRQVRLTTQQGIPTTDSMDTFLWLEIEDIWAALIFSISDAHSLRGVKKIGGVFRVLDGILRSEIQNYRANLIIRMSA